MRQFRGRLRSAAGGGGGSHLPEAWPTQVVQTEGIEERRLAEALRGFFRFGVVGADDYAKSALVAGDSERRYVEYPAWYHEAYGKRTPGQPAPILRGEMINDCTLPESESYVLAAFTSRRKAT